MVTGRAMAVEKVFLGWNRPAVVKATEHLLPREISGPVDLAKDLIVVPTRQAGRRLREALAVHCASQKTALLSPRVVTPSFLLYPEEESGNLAGALETAAVWTDVLTKADPSRYKGLFPARISLPDFTWAMRTAEMIQTLRDTLADGGYRIADVLRDCGHLLEEKDRWEDLAALETAYLERMAGLKLLDPCEAMLRQAENPRLSKGTERIVLAAVPDPTPLVIRVLERLSGQVPIAILVHAPESLADCFDGWGCPLPGRWREQVIDVPDAESNIILAGSPESQSRKVLELLHQEAKRFGTADVALGVPDEGVIPFLAADLLEEGLVPFDPAGRSLARHPVYHLLQCFQALVTEGTYQAFSALVRQADFLDFLEEKHHLRSRRVLQELDEFQNEHLPQELGDIERVLLAGGARGHNAFPNLANAAAGIMEWVRDFQTGCKDAAATESNGQAGIDKTLRSLLEAVYESRTLSPTEPGDVEFAAVAEAIDETFRHLGGPLESLVIDGNKGLELLLWALGGQKYYPEPGDAAVDLEGWLELPWNDAPFLVVTGMNESYVPRSRVSDIFLPDTLRRELGLQNDADWLSRDAYIMSALVESRRQGGRACFIAGKASASGDVLKPSRLLFQCQDDELPRRAERLFSSAAEERINCPSSVTFRLEVTPPRDVPAARLERTKISVTAFRDYLVCPFRFYLKHVLDMEELDDEKAELDARDFGSLIHDVLNRMAEDGEMRRCENPSRIQDYLCTTAADWAAERFGTSPPLHIEIQLESARQRLREAAQVQARLVSEGWETIHSELGIEGQMEGLLVRGKVDRVDRHRRTGRTRVLDYKTSENAQSPDEVHLASVPRDCELPEYMKVEVNGYQRRWMDLQLPLYSILLAADPNLKGPFEVGYFNLPRALPDTGIEIWEGMSGSILDSADACARGVIQDIRRRRFWPPAGRVQYDDFIRLFSAEAAACINVETFESFIRGESR